MAFRDLSEPILLEPARSGATIRYYQAQEAIKQGQVVIHGPTNNDRVSPSDTDGERVAGVALYGVSSDAMVAVAEEGVIARLTSGSGSVSAGDPVASHGATGEEGEVDTAASGDFILGRAKKADDGSNDDVEVVLTQEGFVYGGSPS